MPPLPPLDLDHLRSFAIALALGLLIGLERERHPGTNAGVRTFGIVGLAGALCAALAQQFASVWPVVAGLTLSATMLIVANGRRPDPQDAGTTSVAALLLTFGLGALVWLGMVREAVVLTVATTTLLYFKPELEGLATRITGAEWRSILQFGVLALVVLPVLPDQEFGPYGALNPHQIWLMVVLIAGVGLVGYAALKLAGSRHGAPLTGVLGGLVSSTATTLAFARQAKAEPALAPVAIVVILVANLTMMLRVGVLAAIIAPSLLASFAPLLACGLLPGLGYVLWARRARGNLTLAQPQARNPTELKVALGFGLLYALVLLAAAWLSSVAGSAGLYVVALASGLTDVDAITLSSLRLFNTGGQTAATVEIAIGLAVLANLGFKTGMAVSIAGGVLTRRILPGMGLVGAGLGAGLMVRALV